MSKLTEAVQEFFKAVKRRLRHRCIVSEEENIPTEVDEEEERLWHHFMAGGKPDGSDKPGPVRAEKLKYLRRKPAPDSGSDTAG